MPAAGRDQLARSVTLLRVCLVTSALVLGAGAVLLGARVTATVRSQAIDDAKQNVVDYADSVVRGAVVVDGRLSVSPAARAALVREVAARKDLVSVKVWRRDGTLEWT